VVSKALKTTFIVIGSGVGGIIIFLLVVAGINYVNYGAGEPESSTIFYDESYARKFIEKLDKAGIPYRKEKNGSIWYSVKYQDQIKEIGRSVTSEYPVMFEFSDKARHAEFTKALDERGIKYSSYVIGGNDSVIVPKEYQLEASEAFREVIGVER